MGGNTQLNTHKGKQKERGTRRGGPKKGDDQRGNERENSSHGMALVRDRIALDIERLSAGQPESTTRNEGSRTSKSEKT